jgi:glycosyltransferase involved in cell wall biosynthesis
LFQGAAAFAYPSRAEGFGLPILQAFTLGVPVVTSPLPALQEIAGQAAHFADPEDPRSLCHELMEVLADPNESHRLAYAGYLRAKIFTWEKTAKLTREAYQTALG